MNSNFVRHTAFLRKLAKRTQTKCDQDMQEAQRIINLLLGQEAILEDGFVDDPDTWKAVRQLGHKPGRDFTNYKEMRALLTKHYENRQASKPSAQSVFGTGYDVNMQASQQLVNQMFGYQVVPENGLREDKRTIVAVQKLGHSLGVDFTNPKELLTLLTKHKMNREKS